MPLYCTLSYPVTYEFDREIHNVERGMLLYTCAWRPTHIEKPKGLIVQCCEFADSNTFLPRKRSIRLAEQGFVVVGMDPEGHGRSDGLHAYIPSFPTLVEDYWQWFNQEIKTNPAYKDFPVFLLGESLGGNVAIQLLLRDRVENKNSKCFFLGAVLLAPMVRISPDIKPPEFLVNLLKQVAPFVPTLPVAPTKDVLAQAFRRPEILEMARGSPYGYRMKPRLGTALQVGTLLPSNPPSLPPSLPPKVVLAQAFRRPEILEMARGSPYMYRMKPRLGTALQVGREGGRVLYV